MKIVFIIIGYIVYSFYSENLSYIFSFFYLLVCFNPHLAYVDSLCKHLGPRKELRGKLVPPKCNVHIKCKLKLQCLES